MARDGYVVLASLLTPPEAGMARALLVSEGIDALLEDDALSGIHPLLQLATGGTKLLVPEADAERAQELLDGRGILAGAGTGSEGAPEILEEEWSAKPRDAGAVVPRPVPMNGKMNGRVDGVGAIPLQVAEVEPASLIGEQTARRALAAALLGLILPFGALQIYSLWLAMRSLTASGSLRPGTRSRLALALVLDIAWIVLFAVLVRATLRR